MNREDTMEVMQSGALFTNTGLLETQLMMDPIHEELFNQPKIQKRNLINGMERLPKLV